MAKSLVSRTILRRSQKRQLIKMSFHFERVLVLFSGGEKSALVDVNIHSIEGRLIAEAVCRRYPEPVILVDGDKYEFYIRDGNSTRPLNSQEQYNYTKHHWTEDNKTTPEKMIREVVKEVLSQQHQGPALGERPEEREFPNWKDRILTFFWQSAAGSQLKPGVDTDTEIGGETGRLESLPSWLTVRTRNVLDAYLNALKQSGDWKRLSIISPWLSPLDASYCLTSDGLAQRLKSNGATLYLVTRPPTEPWHTRAIETFAATGRANVAFIGDLHAKLFTASTATSSFALVGSANFTQNSIENMEIGLLVHSYMEGKKVVTALDREAVDIYRTPGRKLIYRAHC